MTKFVAYLVTTYVSSLVFGKFAIAALKKLRAGQPILSYVEEHKSKQGTPTMGGIVFVAPPIVAYFSFFGFESVYALFTAALAVTFALIGFFDDFIKIKFGKNEGLKPWQKTVFLSAASLVGAVFIMRQHTTSAYIPFTAKAVDLGFWSFPLSLFVFLAATNCVNLTDGLDGLAGSVGGVALFFVALITVLQVTLFGNNYASGGELISLSAFCFGMVAAIAGFLAYNVNKASVFMGDAGSLALGGVIAFAFLISGNALYLPFIGWAFVLSGASVIIQVLHYKRTKKRVFLMAPLHHHFQHKGYGEAKITFVYASITAVMGIVCAAAYVGSINVF